MGMDDEVERVAAVVYVNCMLSGYSIVYSNGDNLSCDTGGRFVCGISREEAATKEAVAAKIRKSLGVSG